MVEIPVRHKKKGFLPLWLLPVALVGVLGTGLGLSRAHTSSDHTAITAADRTPMSAAPVAAAACNNDQECGSERVCRGGSCTVTADCGDTRVSFATNSAAIGNEYRSQFDQMASCLQATQSLKLMIEGNADQRGTDEHNADLAERRARAVARELQTRGVSAAQLHVVSYGDHNLLCSENDAECWAQNRRAAVHTETR